MPKKHDEELSEKIAMRFYEKDVALAQKLLEVSPGSSFQRLAREAFRDGVRRMAKRLNVRVA